MLEAKKVRIFEAVFVIYNRFLLKRRFHSVRANGLDSLKATKAEKVPLIVYANHSSWWDGLVFLELLRLFGFDRYVMMEEKQLSALFFFRWLGAFSVVRENPRDAVRSINYAAGLLRERADRLVLIFPQGEILPNDARPLKFYNGLARVIGKTPRCAAVPVALRFEFLGNYKPEIFIKIGAPDFFAADDDFDSKNATPILQKRLTETLDRLKHDVVSQTTDGYEKLF